MVDSHPKICYAVLWIPTIIHKRIVDEPVIDDKIIEKNISDHGSSYKIQLKLKSNNDIDVLTFDDSNNGTPTDFVTLHYKDDSRNGLIEYYYKEKTTGKEGFQFTSKTFPEVVYHLIKGFYHEHEFHEAESDSHLKPFISTEEINIHNNDNPALHHYLGCYETVLSNLVSYARELHLAMIETMEHKKDQIIKAYGSYIKMSINAKGYETYLNALHYSIYNTECRMDEKQCCVYLGHQKNDEHHKDMRRRAFNILNSIQYFKTLDHVFYDQIQQHNFNAQQEIMNQQVQNYDIALSNLELTMKNAKKAVSQAKCALFFTVIFALAGIGASKHYANESSDQIKKMETNIVTAVQTGINSVNDIFKKNMNQPDAKKTKQIRNNHKNELN